MKKSNNEIFMFSIIAAILGWTLYKQFDFETNTFEKPILAAFYGIVFLANIYFIIKNLMRGNRSAN